MDVFAALADPIRRQILDALLHGDLDAGAIAARFPVSRPAISRHLRILRESGLVVANLEGRRRIYRLHPAAFAEIETWLAPHRNAREHHPLVTSANAWSDRFNALDTEVARTKRERRQEASSDSPTGDPTNHDKEQSA